MIPARVIVTGDRNWACRELAEMIVSRLLARFGPGLIIVHGDAAGVDAAFAAACDELGVEQERHPADWDRLGKRAGPIRNAEMVALGAVLCLAVHKRIRFSKGTKNCSRLAIEAGIPTWLIDNDAGAPKRLRLEDLG